MPPSSPAEVRIIVLHPDNKIATAMIKEEGGGLSATMVAADNAGRRGSRRPSRCCWQLKIVLTSSALMPSCNNGGLRGTQKPVARCLNSVANAVAPARCMVYGGGCHGILREEDEGGGGGGNNNNDTDGTDDAGVGNLPPPGEICQSERVGGGNGR